MMFCVRFCRSNRKQLIRSNFASHLQLSVFVFVCLFFFWFRTMAASVYNNNDDSALARITIAIVGHNICVYSIIKSVWVYLNCFWQTNERCRIGWLRWQCLWGFSANNKNTRKRTHTFASHRRCNDNDDHDNDDDNGNANDGDHIRTTKK